MLFALLVGLTADPSTRTPPTLLMIAHHGSTGSHALCDAIGRLSCVHADCSEQFDYAEPSKLVHWLDSEVRTPFAVVLMRFMRHDRKFVAYAEAFPAGRLRVLVLVRTDLMRWSLSLYCKAKGGACFEEHNPQFLKGRSQNLTANYYQPAVLDKAAQSSVRTWRDQAATPSELGDGVPTAFVFYEDLVALGPGAYATWVMQQQLQSAADEGAVEGSSCPWVEDAPALAGGRLAPRPAKYHPDDISSFVANAPEVSALLGASSGRPTWEQVAAEARLDKTMLARPPGLKHSVSEQAQPSVDR